jgi:hypothetical protein
VPDDPGVTARDNFEPLRALDWQVHVHGAAAADLRAMAERRGLPLVEFPRSESAEAAGLLRDAAYLVRPDGYVAVAAAEQATEPIERLLDTFEIVPSPAPAPDATADTELGDERDAP